MNGTCASCGKPLTGRFCSGCGELRFDPDALTVRHFLTHTLGELFEVDGKVWTTIRSLLFRPGFLSLEYCAGRRVRYINPVRLLVTTIIVYALLTQGGLMASMFIGPVSLSITPTAVPEGESIKDTVLRLDRFRLLTNLVAEKERQSDLDSEQVRGRFHDRLHRYAEPLSFANVFLLAVTLYALFHRKRLRIAEHGVFSLHLLSFVLLSSLVLLIGVRMTEFSDALGLLLFMPVVIWQFVYLALAIRRFYFSGAKGIRTAMLSAAVAVLLYVVNSFFITGVQALGGALALWSI